MRSYAKLSRGVGYQASWFALCIAAASAAGCFSPDRPTCAFMCGPDHACPDDYSCGTDNRCHLLADDGQLLACEDELPVDAAEDGAPHDGATVDTAPGDGARVDAVAVDAGPVDAGAADGPATIPDGSAGAVDAVPADAVPSDAAIDAVPVDAVPIDAAPADAGPIDAAPADAAPADAAPADAAPADAAPIDAAPSDAAPDDAAPSFTMTIDGIREPQWSQPGVTAAAESTGQYRLPQDLVQTVYVTNDGDYLYIGVDGFTDPWDDGYAAYLHVYLTRDLAVSGAITADGAANTAITFAAGSHLPDGLGRFSWSRYGDASAVSGMIDAGAASDGFVEVRIPLESIGAGVGDTIGLIVGARADSGEAGLCDLAPYRSSVTSDYGSQAAAVDPSAADYLPYTVY